MMKHIPFLKNTLWQYGLQAIKYLLPLITLPYLTRVLKPDGYAIYAYVVSMMTFVQVFVDFGFNLSGTKSMIRAKSVSEKNRIIGTIFEARLILCIIAGIIVFIAALLIPITSQNMGYTMLAYVAVCGRALAPDFVFQGHENMGPLTTRYLASKGTSTILTFVFVHSVGDILWVPILDIVASAIALIWSFASARRLFGTTMAKAPLSACFEELKVSGYYCASNVASVVFTGFTTLFIGVTMTDVAYISYWSLAMMAVSAVQSLYTPITNSLYPRMIASEDYRFGKKLALVALPVVLIGTVAFALLARPLMLVLGGQNYLPGAQILIWVSPVLFFSFFGMLCGWPILGAAGKVKELTLSTVVSAAFSIVLLMILAFAGWDSLLAIAVVRVATEALMCGLRLGACWKLQSQMRKERQV